MTFTSEWLPVILQSIVIGIPAIFWAGGIHKLVRNHDQWIHEADRSGTAATRVVAATVTADAHTLEQLATRLTEHAETMAGLAERLGVAETRLAVVETRCGLNHPNHGE